MAELSGYLLDIPAEFLKNPAGEIILLGAFLAWLQRRP
jgi:hypothetical protein